MCVAAFRFLHKKQHERVAKYVLKYVTTENRNQNKNISLSCLINRSQ